ncbi:MAG: hypothetical protein IPL88_13160 [Rhizobiales bacterium]|nr:hypothetical protein [Hyphomicrobiales bacterium]
MRTRKLARVSATALLAAMGVVTLGWLDWPAPTAGRIPAPAGAAMAQTPTAVVENLSFDLGVAVYRIRRMEVIGSPMSADDWRATLTGGQGATAERLAALKADSINIPELEYEVTAGGMRQTIVYRDVILLDIAGGRIAQATASGGTLSGAADGESMSGEFGPLVFTGIDVAGMARLFATGQTSDGKPVVAYESARFADYTLKMKKADIAIRGMAGGPVKMKPTGEPLSAMFAMFAAMPAKPQPSEAFAIFGSASKLLRAMSVGSSSVDEMTMRIKEGADPVTFTISGVQARDFEDAVVGSTVIQSVTAGNDAGFAMRLGPIEVRGYDMRPTLETLASIAADPSSLDSFNPMRMMPRIDHFSLRNFDLTSAAKDAPANAAPLKVTIDNISADRDLKADSLRWRLAHDHIRVSGEAGDKRLSGMQELGYSSLDLSFRTIFDWSWATGEASLSTDGSGAGMGVYSAKVDVSNLTEAIFTADRKIAAVAALPIAVKKAEARVEDNGLIAAAVNLRARNKKIEKSAARREMAAEARKPFDANKKIPFMDKIADAVEAFLRDPKSPLLVTLTASPGVSIFDAATSKQPEQVWSKVKVETSRK